MRHDEEFKLFPVSILLTDQDKYLGQYSRMDRVKFVDDIF